MAQKEPMRRPARRRRRKNYLPFYILNMLALVIAGVFLWTTRDTGEKSPRLIPQAQAGTLPEDSAPVITGVADITVSLGEAVSYLDGVQVTDDRDEAPQLTVDTAQVDLSRPGVYTVVYIARDSAGNETRMEAQVAVRKPEYYVEPEVIYAAVDAVLSGIITDDMTTRQKVEAIYAWTKGNLRYGDRSIRGDYVQSGYEMLQSGQGDCYGYFAVTKLMLERLGILNLDVCKTLRSDTDSEHYWSLVSVDGGKTWYHLDTTPRVGQTEELCLVTDLFLDSFDTYHDGCHNRDKSAYPATPEGWS